MKKFKEFLVENKLFDNIDKVDLSIYDIIDEITKNSIFIKKLYDADLFYTPHDENHVENIEWDDPGFYGYKKECLRCELFDDFIYFVLVYEFSVINVDRDGMTIEADEISFGITYQFNPKDIYKDAKDIILIKNVTDLGLKDLYNSEISEIEEYFLTSKVIDIIKRDYPELIRYLPYDKQTKLTRYGL